VLADREAEDGVRGGEPEAEEEGVMRELLLLDQRHLLPRLVQEDLPPTQHAGSANAEMCSGSEAGSYSRLIHFGYHSTAALPYSGTGAARIALPTTQSLALGVRAQGMLGWGVVVTGPLHCPLKAK